MKIHDMKWKITEYRNISALSEEIRCNKGLTYNPARWTSSYTQSTNMGIFASKFPHVPFPLLQAYSLLVHPFPYSEEGNKSKFFLKILECQN